MQKEQEALEKIKANMEKSNEHTQLQMLLKML